MYGYVSQRPHTHQYNSLIRAEGYAEDKQEGRLQTCFALLDEMHMKGDVCMCCGLVDMYVVCVGVGFVFVCILM